MANEQIIIDDGLKVYDLASASGKVYGQIVFNPSDTNLVKRYKIAVEKLQNVLDTVGDPEERKKINPDNPFEDLDPLVYQIVDELLNNADASKLIFSVCGPFSPLPSKQFYIESVFLAVGNVIEKETGERVKRINTKVKKYTGKYHA